jgi:hypothetical protein
MKSRIGKIKSSLAFVISMCSIIAIGGSVFASEPPRSRQPVRVPPTLVIRVDNNSGETKLFNSRNYLEPNVDALSALTRAPFRSHRATAGFRFNTYPRYYRGYNYPRYYPTYYPNYYPVVYYPTYFYGGYAYPYYPYYYYNVGPYGYYFYRW